jgi:hypothetical protein
MAAKMNNEFGVLSSKVPNKASQRDTKIAASLWFSRPCWQRYVYQVNFKGIESCGIIFPNF